MVTGVLVGQLARDEKHLTPPSNPVRFSEFYVLQLGSDVKRSKLNF